MADTYRLRVCFGKTGRLRHLSHLETMRACERAVRRAGLPYAVSQGFTPRMKVAFGPALPVGTAGEREYFDLLLTRFVPPEEVCHALQRVSVPEIAPLRCTYVAAKEASLGAALTIATYDIAVKGGIPPEEVECSLARLMETGSLEVVHKGKQKVFDLTEVLPKEPEVVSAADHTLVALAVWTGERGSLRPEVLLGAALGREVPLSVTRTGLFIEDEGVWRRPQ